ncbi:DUF4136 domain-containing protein [Halieaceae bacterium IMCC14734]|uniref:DUF4136 domain-containing protein n=1 Tax=Candidatus Litorirhabdus singularis TaxID=2518993 RepID=A0ABT3TDJ2_9GAMM|nr:DUF4136 domain-containing protein [Candidatus Litorirhabdus singularis]MCX2980377.1 DUF4136 domain-containing protein [Candidatus Litorirhabdus singularis]
MNIAKYPLRLALLALLGTFITACASAPPEPTVDFKSDYDFSPNKTISFMPNSGQVSGDLSGRYISDITRDRIDLAIRQVAEAKGYQFVDDAQQADVLLTWHLVGQDKTDVRTTNTGSSYGASYGRYGAYNRHSMYSCWSCGGTETTVRQYTQGTFIVDLIDPELQQSVWRSVIESKLKDNASQEQATYDQAANRILAALPGV